MVDESRIAPKACEYWQMNRLSRSPLNPYTPFLRWLQTDSEENYRRQGNKAFSIESVGYHFNSLGYRGDEFELDSGRVRVVFLGDSNTFGLGTPWEGLWTAHVTKHLEERWGMPVHQSNLAWGGTGSDYIAMTIHPSVEVLKPAAVFVLWPLVRRATWFDDAGRPVHFIPQWIPGEYRKDHEAFLRLATEPYGFFNYVRNFHIVNDRLVRLGIPYYWGNIEAYSPELLSRYVPLDRFAGVWHKLDFARDGLHGGLKSHISFANLVISAIERDKVSPYSWPGR